MKVLQIINSLATGGAEKLLLDTLPLYHQKGISVDLLVLNGSDTPFLKKLKVQSCCRIFSLGTGSVYNPLLIFKIIPYLRKYDLIHVHLFPAQYWVVFAKVLSFSKVKLIFTEHSTSNRRIQNPLFGFVDVVVYRFFYKIVCITSEVKYVVEQHTRVSAEKLVIIENGVPIENIKNAMQLSKGDFFNDSNSSILLQVSSFKEPKDQKTLITALSFLPYYVKLLLVGQGPLKEEAKVLVKKLNLEERVLFLGYRSDIPNLLKTVDIVVLSSKYEGLSLSSIEGMAAGKPFVASNVPGLAAVVDGAGVLFEKGNAIDLADKISALLADKAYYESVAVACQQRAADYDIHKMVAQHIDLYRTYA